MREELQVSLCVCVCVCVCPRAVVGVRTDLPLLTMPGFYKGFLTTSVGIIPGT